MPLGKIAVLSSRWNPWRGRSRPLSAWRSATARVRSEEHTSELQSQSNLVCRLLLEKKKLTYQKPYLCFPHSHNRTCSRTPLPYDPVSSFKYRRPLHREICYAARHFASFHITPTRIP